ncbi:hypothetical protein EST38_g302 [Candolleomyces aberdarensis]|uniref:Uncharacterized protein n=1 Tax=Candolleomyces aberdarensis TaxID=2316362 RepID=A0A4Q2DYM7_9AGAR|nr:hypothetical protein EST38_g302 [Candolleomyces aberdarensis]
MSSENDNPPSAAPTRTKSRLVRLLTTRKPRDGADNARPSKRPGVTSAYSKEQREAALRARGLLPPLDMSQQERELDSSIPVVRHQATESIDADTGMSAADLIKQQWAAKNKESEEHQRKRLNSFKFGGSSTDLQSNQAEPQESKDSSDEESKSDVAPSKPDVSATTTTTPASPKTVRARKRQGLHQASLSQPLVIGVEALRDDHKRSRSTHNKALPVAPASESEAPPLTPVSDLPTEFQAYLNVPPSPVEPTPTKKHESGRTSAAEKLQHSSRPSKESNHSGRGRLSPLPVDTVTKASPALPNKTTLVSPSSAISPTDTLVNGSHHGRNNSIPRAGSGSSSLVDSASSTTQSSDSLASPGVKLVTKSVDNGFPVIMESPVEGSNHEAVSMDHVLASADVVSSSGHGHDDAKEASPPGAGSSDSLPPPPVPERDRDTKQHTPIKSPKLGAVADQVLAQQESTTPMVQRKKTINPFKRNQQPAAEGGTPVKRSLRSVVGTVLRPRRDTESNGGVQPPTSPTSPHGRAVSPPPQAPGSPTKRHQQPAVVRQAVNPVYYSGGDISAQANAIKNDEERRMAELAFMF